MGDDARDPMGEGWPAGRALPVRTGPRQCVWCGAELAAHEGGHEPVAALCCDGCAQLLAGEGGQGLEQFIARLPAPVLVVDGSAVVLAANEKACVLLGKARQEIDGRRGGEVIECAVAGLPGGCGGTVHCEACAIRRTVLDTHATGIAHESVFAYQDILRPDGVRKMWFEISTRRFGRVVLLRIDAVGAERRA